jgi:hypothetical protein
MGDMNGLIPAPGNPNQNIQTFSLQWHKGKANPPPASPGYWSFKVQGNPNALAHIPALTGPTGRFPGLLNYAVYDVAGDDYVNIGPTLSLIASLMDQYDNASVIEPITGSTTTVIAYNSKDSNIGDGDVYVYGMENSDPNRPAWAPIPPPGYVQLDRPFRNIGEFGYDFKQASIRPDNTVDFSSLASLHPPILDLFTYNSAPVRSGIVSLNTRQPAVLAAILRRAITNESTSAIINATNSDALNAATTIVNASAVTPALSRADIVRLASLVTTIPFDATATDQIRETIPRALAEVVQTRTWGLLIDIVAQTGHYPPNAASGPNLTNPLANFVVDGEKRYWLHVAIDRFDGTVVGQQLEEVLE